MGLDLLWLFYPVPVDRVEEQGTGSPLPRLSVSPCNQQLPWPCPSQAPHLGSGCADVLHVLNAAHTIVGHFAAGQPDIVPEAPLPI